MFVAFVRYLVFEFTFVRLCHSPRAACVVPHFAFPLASFVVFVRAHAVIRSCMYGYLLSYSTRSHRTNVVASHETSYSNWEVVLSLCGSSSVCSLAGVGSCACVAVCICAWSSGSLGYLCMRTARLCEHGVCRVKSTVTRRVPYTLHTVSGVRRSTGTSESPVAV